MPKSRANGLIRYFRGLLSSEGRDRLPRLVSRLLCSRLMNDWLKAAASHLQLYRKALTYVLLGSFPQGSQRIRASWQIDGRADYGKLLMVSKGSREDGDVQRIRFYLISFRRDIKGVRSIRILDQSKFRNALDLK